MQKFLTIALLFFCSTAIYSQSLTANEIDQLVERSMKAFDVPGIAVGIIKDGKVIHAKGYGLRSLNTQQKTDENTLFGIASNSKAFTCTALGILVDEGKLKWDDKVETIFLSLKYTVHMLLRSLLSVTLLLTAAG